MAEPIINVLGPVAIKHVGEYNNATHYDKLNVVTYNGSSYCAKESTLGNLPTNTQYWGLMAEKGDQGDTGATPEKGVDYYTPADVAELEASLASDVTDEVTEQLGALTSATPLVATSTAGMTDTSRIYVLTTDGHWYWYDGDSWEDGGQYQAAEDSDTLQDVSEKVGIYWENIIPLTNYLDYDNLENGKYYKNGNVGTTIQTGSASGYFTIPPFKVQKDVTYHYVDCPSIGVAFSKICDEDGVILEAYVNQAGQKFTPNYDGYAYITFTSGSPQNYPNAMIYVNDYPPKTFVPFNTIYNFIILNTNYKNMYDFYDAIKDIEFAIPHQKVTVGTGKDFTTITAAVASIEDSSENKIYDIIIDDGTYAEHSIELPDYVNLIGASGIKENCVIRGYLDPDVSDNGHRSISTIDMSMNNELRNLTITAQNMRYPVHDESEGAEKDWLQIVDNCHIEHFGNQEIIDYRAEHGLDPGNPWSSPHAWGMGASSGCKLNITNSTFKSVGNAFYIHGASNFTSPYLITIEDTNLISTTRYNSIYVDNTTPTIDGNTMIVKNCFLNGRYATVINASYKHYITISGSDVVPVYQRPGQVCNVNGYPIFTNNTKMLRAGESLTKGTFVKSLDGITVTKADSTTPLNEIIGYVLGDSSAGDTVYVNSKYMQPSSQNWPETSIVSGVDLYLDNSGKITTTAGTIKIGVTQDRWYKLYI